MNNIEKFEKLKQLYKLKCELHKENMMDFFDPASQSGKFAMALETAGLVKKAVTLFRQFRRA